MTTPRSVEQFTAWRVLWAVFKQLGQIQRANGYNCDAAVYLDAEEYRNSTEKCALLVYSDSESPDDQQVGGDGSPRVQSAIGITIWGSVKYESDIPARVQMALEQDVRTAVQSQVKALRASTGTGVSFRWGECQRMISTLSAEREAGFSLTCTFLHVNGSTW